MVTTPVSENTRSDTQLMQDIWSERWQSLRDMIDQFIGSDPPGSVVPRYDGIFVPRWGTLQSLITGLRKFAEPNYDYFRQGFTSGHLQTSKEIPPDSVYSAVLDQAGNDLEVIQSIVLQRLSGISPETSALRESDQLAMFSLIPAIEAGWLSPNTTALTYFQKTPIVRVVPYAEVALIGIPFTTLRTSSDLLGTAHEAGHFVFWHAYDSTSRKYLYEILRGEVEAANLPPWCMVWLEEMFADIYGCLIFGPVMAAANQELQRKRTERDFRTSDEDHPVPRLRPVVYLKVLQQSAFTERKAWVAKLDRRWKQLMNSRNLTEPSTFVVSGPKNIDTDILVGQATDENNFALDLTKPVDKMCDLILKHIGNIERHWPQRLPFPDLPPLVPDNDDVTLSSLYQWFDIVRGVAISRVTVTDVPPISASRQVWFGSHGYEQFTLPMDQKEWRLILEAGGWATEPVEKPWP